ncbi:MAG TPA: prepilin-type N-terminal cleavage/methylation domain-containing protein [Candidatus Paceibacterota bacterium]
MDQSVIKIKNQSGQSLVEILIAVAVGGALILAASTLIAVVLRVSATNKYLQAASYLSQELLDEVTVYSEAKWYYSTSPPNYGIYNLAKGSGNHYYLNISVSPFQWVQGDETGASTNIDGVQYARYFYVENVCRDLNNSNIVSLFSQGSSCVLGKEDPSTQKVTAVTSWPQGGEVRISKFVTRSRNNAFHQTDWYGGPTSPTPIVIREPDNKFFSSESIDFYSVVGEISIQQDISP